jgi:hypothetical protein
MITILLILISWGRENYIKECWNSTVVMSFLDSLCQVMWQKVTLSYRFLLLVDCIKSFNKKSRCHPHFYYRAIHNELNCWMYTLDRPQKVWSLYTNDYHPVFFSRAMVFNATFNNISVIWCWLVLLVEETRIPGENHRPVASHWQTLSHNVVSPERHSKLC